MNKLLSGLIIVGSMLVSVNAFAGTNITKYEVPDVKDDYCGVELAFQNCKCAFHDEFCADISLDQNSAYDYVLTSFRQWNRERIQAMGESCILQNGYWNKSNWSCTTCTDGDTLNGQKCVAQETSDEEKPSECDKALEDFANDWEKYSDIDDAIPSSDASYEAQQYNRALESLIEKIGAAQALEYDMEVDRQFRLELREYKKALVQNIRNNVTKAIFRLAWVTYDTIKSARGSYGSYQKLLHPDSVVEGLGAGMKLIQSNIPANRKDLQFDTTDTRGRIRSAAWNAALETLESVGNPKDIALQAVKDLRSGVTQSPSLSDAEIAILRIQHLENRGIDKVLADSYALNAGRRQDLLILEQEISSVYNEMQEWKSKEHERVRLALIESCKDK